MRSTIGTCSPNLIKTEIESFSCEKASEPAIVPNNEVIVFFAQRDKLYCALHLRYKQI